MHTERKFDIAVIGGGPAGILAATFAAKAGRSVCLIDRKKTPGYPVRCGEAIGLKGFASSVELKPEWIRSRISFMRLVSPSGISVTVPNNYEGYIVDRELMENDLTADAVAAGAAFLPGTSILSVVPHEKGGYEARTRDSVIRSECVILAEGVESRLARELGWKTSLAPADIHSCAFARISHPAVEQGACVFYLGTKRAPGGYVWVFHRGGTIANVGLGVIGSRCERGLPGSLLKRFIDETFPGADVSDHHCGGVPMGRWIRPLVKNGVMLAGDAAHMMNCVSGAGIAYALYSGKIAGITAAKSFADSTCSHAVLKEYQAQWASFYGKQQDRSHAVKEVMVGFTDAFLDDVARSIAKNGK